jgi:uncharacterized protein with HEPN domain
VGNFSAQPKIQRKRLRQVLNSKDKENRAEKKTEFRKEYEETIPWRTMVGMRNLFAHHYHVMDKSEIWDTVQTKIPTLIEFCNKVITE